MNSQIDITALDVYLQAHSVGIGKIQSAEKFFDGQSNPTYLLSADSGQYVLRKQPGGKLLKSAHAVDREFRVMHALQNTEVPVPNTLHLCQDRDVIGGMFFIMSYEEGRIFWNPVLPGMEQAQRTKIYDEMNRIIAALHDIDLEQSALQDFGKPGNYFERQVGRWTQQYRASEIETIVEMDQLIEWLPLNMPEDDGKVSLIHGDYRIDNIIFEPTRPNARAVIDWELSTLGHPYSDIAYQCMQWRLDQNAVIPGLGDIDRETLGIPSEADYVAKYCERRGLSAIPDWEFCLAFSFFRFAAILQGVLKRAIDGNASSKKALEYGALAPTLAKMAVALID